MNPTRRLALRTERLAELAAEELRGLGGGAADQSGDTCKCPDYTYFCITGYAICRTRICP